MDDADIQRLANELGRLGAIVSGIPHSLTIELQDDAETWSFNWRDNIVTIPTDDLSRWPADNCRGIMLHEAGHAALSLEWAFAPESIRRRYAYLINLLEDMRIETWLPQRLPGCADWLQPQRRQMAEELKNQPWPDSQRGCFVRAIFEEWVLGAPTADCPQDLQRQLTALWPYLHAYRSCHPAEPRQHLHIEARWQVWLRHHSWHAHADWAPLVHRVCQIEAWQIAVDHLFPFWDRLCAADGGQPEDGDSALQQVAEVLRLLHCMVSAVRQSGAQSASAAQESSAGEGGQAQTPADDDSSAKGSGASPSVEHLRQVLQQGSSAGKSWQQALQRVDDHTEALSEELLHSLVPRQRSRWCRDQRRGSHVDLRAAMQAEADPRRGEQVWQRRQRPDRIDPAVAVLVDRSASMDGEAAEHALAGLVLIVEACVRCGIPCGVWTFASDCQLAWDRDSDGAARNALARQVLHADGGTELAEALGTVGQAIVSWPEEDRFVIVLTDGDASDVSEAKGAVERLTAAGIGVVGLGIGSGTDAVASTFPLGRSNLPLDQVPLALGEVLRDLLKV